MVSSFPKILRSSASFSQSIRNRVRLKKLQAQAKNFCRVLDIRVPQIMETEVGNSGISLRPLGRDSCLFYFWIKIKWVLL